MRKNNIFILTSILFFAFVKTIYGQEQKDTIPNDGYHEFYQLFKKSKSVDDKLFYINKIIKKAKNQKNVKELITGYQFSSLLFNRDKEIKIKYLDSVISLSKEIKEYDFFTASMYLEKGGELYLKRDFKTALDHFLLVLDKTDNEFLRYKANYNIAVLKDRTGDHLDALNIYKDNFNFAKKRYRNTNGDLYINSVYALANTFNYLNQLDSANYYNKLGVEESLLLNKKTKYSFFVLNQGTTHYLKGEYDFAIDSLKQASKLFITNHDSINYAESSYYLGKSYAKKNRHKEAVISFKNVDSVFREKKDVLPIMRGAYEYLIDYYKKRKNLKSQLVYVNQLMKLDSVLHKNELYLNKNIIREYDIPRLIDEKEKIIHRLAKKQKIFRIFIYTLIPVLVLAFCLLFYQNKRKRLYKKRFEEIVNTTKNSEDDNVLTSQKVKKNINIPKEIIHSILKSLESFEKEEKYLSNNITLQTLAKDFQTNTSYLSKVINEYKKMSFARYLNRLRIEFATEQLKVNLVFRKYTIRAIAEEVGFNNPESFSKAFYKKNGIQPSYYIKELDRIKAGNDNN